MIERAGTQVAVLNQVVRLGLIVKVIFVQRLEKDDQTFAQ